MEWTQVLRRVGIALLVFFGIHAVGGAVDFATGASHSFTVDLLSLILGILLLYPQPRRGGFATFVYAFELVSVAAGLGLGIPIVLWVARGQLSALPLLGLLWSVLCTAAEGIFAWWVVRELRNPAVETILASVGRGSNRRASLWGGGFAVGMVAVVGAVALLAFSMWPRWTAPAVAAAHAQLGEDWQVSVVSYKSTSRAGWHAHVVARRGDEVKELDVEGQ